jgi:hypothetical protein
LKKRELSVGSMRNRSRNSDASCLDWRACWVLSTPPESMTTADGPPLDLGRLIDALSRHQVEYLLCGGAAATAYGAERVSEDADCVVRRDRANLSRLAAAMRGLSARLRVAGMADEEARHLPVQLDADTLADLSVTTWKTDAGAFDALAGLAAPDGRLVPYEELVGRATVLRGRGFTVQAACLDDIIRAKERASRPKDLEALPELRAIRDGRHADRQAEPGS